MTVKKKKLITLCIFKSGNKDYTYRGRCLGLITEKQFASILEDNHLRRRLKTVATTPIAAIGNKNNVDGLRLAMIIHEKDDVAIRDNRLFITEPLSLVDSLKGPDMSMITKADDSYILVEEEEK